MHVHPVKRVRTLHDCRKSLEPDVIPLPIMSQHCPLLAFLPPTQVRDDPQSWTPWERSEVAAGAR